MPRPNKSKEKRRSRFFKLFFETSVDNDTGIHSRSIIPTETEFTATNSRLGIPIIIPEIIPKQSVEPS